MTLTLKRKFVRVISEASKLCNFYQLIKLGSILTHLRFKLSLIETMSHYCICRQKVAQLVIYFSFQVVAWKENHQMCIRSFPFLEIPFHVFFFFFFLRLFFRVFQFSAFKQLMVLSLYHFPPFHFVWISQEITFNFYQRSNLFNEIYWFLPLENNLYGSYILF